MHIITIFPPLVAIQIDRMRKSDLPAVMEIERQSFSDPWDEASFREGIAGANPHAYFLVARHQQAPIAFINFWVVREDAHITNFAVAPTYRNMGVGKYFFARSLEYIKKRGGRKVFLEVRVSNIRAQNLYRQFGFKIISIRKRYYADNGEDAYVFSVDLGDLDLRIRDEHARNLV